MTCRTRSRACRRSWALSTLIRGALSRAWWEVGHVSRSSRVRSWFLDISRSRFQRRGREKRAATSRESGGRKATASGGCERSRRRLRARARLRTQRSRLLSSGQSASASASARVESSRVIDVVVVLSGRTRSCADASTGAVHSPVHSHSPSAQTCTSTLEFAASRRPLRVCVFVRRPRLSPSQTRPRTGQGRAVHTGYRVPSRSSRLARTSQGYLEGCPAVRVAATRALTRVRRFRRRTLIAHCDLVRVVLRETSAALHTQAACPTGHRHRLDAVARSVN